MGKKVVAALISAAFLTLLSAPALAEPADATFNTQNTQTAQITIAVGGTEYPKYVTNADDVSLRKAADKSSSRITRLKKGTAVGLVEAGSEYSKVIISDGRTGYIANEYISAASAAPAEDNSPETITIGEETYQKATVNASSVAMREKSDSKSKKLKTLKKGTAVGLVSAGSEYFQVILEDGQKGYIAKQYLTVKGGVVYSPNAKTVQNIDAFQYWTKPDDAPSISLSAEDLEFWNSVPGLSAEAKSRNSDVQGYIFVPGTNIKHPVVIGKDNDYYMYRDYLKRSDKKGAIFFDYRNNNVYQRRNLILWGHNMSTSKTMFHYLVNYKNADWTNQHQIIWCDAFGGSVWQFISVYVALPESQYFRTQFTSDSDWMAYITKLQSLSYHAGKTPAIQLRPNDQILTLASCSYDVKPKGRLFVCFRRIA